MENQRIYRPGFWVPLLVLSIGIAIGSCSPAKSPTAVTSEDLGPSQLLDRNGGVSVYQMEGHKGLVAVRYVQVAYRDASTRRVVLVDWDTARDLLPENAPAVLLSIWRYVPEARAYDRSLSNEMPTQSDFKKLPGFGTFELEYDPGSPPDPPPPPTTPCKCCPDRTVEGTWGCIKCCY